jgi:allophanate hydrolase subunit 1
LFDITADTPSLLAAGDRVRFHAIDEATFQQLAATKSR